jgi:hypothetical protein
MTLYWWWHYESCYIQEAFEDEMPRADWVEDHVQEGP